jgi:hypothetical protein
MYKEEIQQLFVLPLYFPHDFMMSRVLIYTCLVPQLIQSSLRILSETGVFPRKTSRIRPRFRRNLCGRIPDRITPEKIRSVLVGI